MDTINNDRSAFPIPTAVPGNAWMTLRDYFAGQALNALVIEALRLDHKSWDATGQHAYYIADSLIKAREVKHK